MKMKYREIQRIDIPVIFAVRVATWGNDRAMEELEVLGITPASTQAAMTRGSLRGWLCETKRQAIGFAMGDKTNGEMTVIAVLKDFEGKGVGKKLLSLVEDWLWTEGWQEIWLTTYIDEDERAIGFYRHLGWQDWKIDGDRYMRKKG